MKIDRRCRFARRTGGVESTASNPDGSFELFNYPVTTARGRNRELSKGAVSFVHPDYIETEIEDIYALAPRNAKPCGSSSGRVTK